MVVKVSRDEVRRFLAGRSDVPLEQSPSWADVSTWDPILLGWRDGDGNLRGSAVVLERPLPRTPWRLAYVPEGPVLDWDAPGAAADLDELVSFLRARGAFLVKVGPRLPVRRWRAATIRAAMAEEPVPQRWRDVPPDETAHAALVDSLTATGWRRYEAPGPGFGGTLQPRYGFELALAGRTPDELLANMSTQWRRNIRRAEKSGVVVETPGRTGLATFHRLVATSGDRRGFVPRDLEYFERYWDALEAVTPGCATLYTGAVDGVVQAAMLAVRSGDRVSYTHGGSDDDGRTTRAGNAVQWRMATDALRAGAAVLDLRGAADGLRPGSPEVGLTGFKAGLGADAVEYLGEWDLVTRPVGHAFRWWWHRRPH